MARSLASIGAAVLLAACAGGAAAGGANVITVTNDAELMKALASAHGGETIRLAPGVYSDLGHPKGLNYASPVTITSADPSHPAVIAPFYLYNSSNIRFIHLEFSAAGSSDPHAYRVYESKNIAFDHDSFHGNLDAPPSTAPMNGLAFFSSANISVTNSEFTHLNHALSSGTGNGVIFSNNSFHDMRCDGIDIASSNDVVVEDNVFTDFHWVPGDHPDAIQLWGNPASPVHNVKISGNLYVRGAGLGIQGIFVNDKPGWVRGVTVSNNSIGGGAYNGIDVAGGNDIDVASNTVAAYPDQESWIRLDDNDGGKEANNVSSKYIFDHNTKISQVDNRTGRPVSDGGKALVIKWLAAHPGWTGTFPASLAHLVGAAPTGAGSSVAPGGGA